MNSLGSAISCDETGEHPRRWLPLPGLLPQAHSFVIFPTPAWWLNGKESTCDAGDTGVTGLIPGSGRSPGGGNGNPLQYSCPKNLLDWEVQWITVHRVTNWACVYTHPLPHLQRLITSVGLVPVSVCPTICVTSFTLNHTHNGNTVMSLVPCLSSLPLFWSSLCLSFCLECVLSSLSKPAHFSKSESRNEEPGREKEEGGKASRREGRGSSRCFGQLYEVPLALPRSWSKLSTQEWSQSRISSVALVLRCPDVCVCVCVCVCTCMCAHAQLLSCVDFSLPHRLYVAYQAPLSMGLCRQEYWSGLACPPPGDLPNPGVELAYLALAGRFLTTSATRETPIRR